MLLLFLSGCMVIWTDQVFIATIFKTVETKELGLIVDPNRTQIGSGQTTTENDKIKASAIIGGIPVSLETTNGK